LDKGTLLINQSPNQLTQINSTIEIKQNQARIQGGFQIEGQQAHFTGEMSLQDTLSANIDLYAASLPLIFPPQLVAEVSPTLNLSLANDHIMLSGNIDVLAGSYNIEKLPQGSINLSDDVVFVDNQGEKLITPESHLTLTTDIKVNINNGYKVYGQGLQTELQGQLALKQKAQQPLQVFGKIQSQQGSYQAYGQKLTIEQGELSFNGAVTNPYMTLRASRYINADDLTVGINITGLANALNMQLFSKPTLENAEILSFLTRGRGLDGENSNANAAASMLIGIGLSNSTQVFEQLEKIPLINNITLDTEGSDDSTQAVISGYVGDRVYLKYGIGVFEPINELTVRLYLLNRLWLEVVSGLEQSGDIYYSFDID
jgi:translocation and assembly module TamB